MGSISNLLQKDVDHFARVGHFLFWFSAAELGITNLLVKCLGYEAELSRAEILISGMDARVKCQRLFEAEKIGLSIGPNLRTRIHHFEKVMIPIRNYFAHRVPVPKDDFVVFTNSIDAAPPLESARKIANSRLFAEAQWLNWFAAELAQALTHAARTGILEIARPQSEAPAHRHPKEKKGQPASVHKRKKKPPPPPPTADLSEL